MSEEEETGYHSGGGRVARVYIMSSTDPPDRTRKKGGRCVVDGNHPRREVMTGNALTPSPLLSVPATIKYGTE